VPLVELGVEDCPGGGPTGSRTSLFRSLAQPDNKALMASTQKIETDFITTIICHNSSWDESF
jgi:hypothetical protein